MKLLTEVRTALYNAFGETSCHSVLLPGNHDCDFKKDNAARKSLGNWPIPTPSTMAQS